MISYSILKKMKCAQCCGRIVNNKFLASTNIYCLVCEYDTLHNRLFYNKDLYVILYYIRINSAKSFYLDGDSYKDISVLIDFDSYIYRGKFIPINLMDYNNHVNEIVNRLLLISNFS